MKDQLARCPLCEKPGEFRMKVPSVDSHFEEVSFFECKDCEFVFGVEKTRVKEEAA